MLDQRVEERFAVVLHVAHITVLQKIGVAAVQNPLAALTLVFKSTDVGRQKAMQAEGVALLFGKGSALVEPGVQQQSNPVKTGPDHAVDLPALPEFLTH